MSREPEYPPDTEETCRDCGQILDECDCEDAYEREEADED